MKFCKLNGRWFMEFDTCGDLCVDINNSFGSCQHIILKFNLGPKASTLYFEHNLYNVSRQLALGCISKTPCLIFSKASA